MRSLCLSFVLGVSPLLLGVAPSQAVAQNLPQVQPGMGMSQFTPGTVSSPAYQMSYGGSDTYAMPSGGYSPYQPLYGGYNSSPYQTPDADAIEVSGPLKTPPPHRAIIRLRLPRTWADVAIDGLTVDSMGQSRTYVTPELSGARTFVVTAYWQNNGRTTLIQEQVRVDAGQVRTLDFTSDK